MFALEPTLTDSYGRFLRSLVFQLEGRSLWTADDPSSGTLLHGRSQRVNYQIGSARAGARVPGDLLAFPALYTLTKRKEGSMRKKRRARPGPTTLRSRARFEPPTRLLLILPNLLTLCNRALMRQWRGSVVGLPRSHWGRLSTTAAGKTTVVLKCGVSSPLGRPASSCGTGCGNSCCVLVRLLAGIRTVTLNFPCLGGGRFGFCLPLGPFTQHI